MRDNEIVETFDSWDPLWLTPTIITEPGICGVHLVVLVHGFQGNSLDMRMLRNCLFEVKPDMLFLMSRSNEEDTEGDISEMGQLLANEVQEYI